MKIAEIIAYLETIAPPSLQESYDNAGLITGKPEWICKAAIICLDSTPEVVQEAISTGSNLIIAHHPIVFTGLKKINGANYVEEAIILAIKNDIAIYAIHTNLDNVIGGVNKMMADKLNLVNRSVLAPKKGILRKLHVFVPADHAEKLRDALFAAGGGHIGKYSECSFSAEGIGTFKAGKDADPFVGKVGTRHQEQEVRLELIFPAYQAGKIITAMKATHPYEEVAYDLVPLDNSFDDTGSGITGELAQPVTENDFLGILKSGFGLKIIRHSAFTGKPISKVALCGGAGSFLIFKALAISADAFITSDLKYHEFFDANNRMMICDIGHFESEQFTVDLLYDILREKFTNFAVLKTKVKTNPVHYFM